MRSQLISFSIPRLRIKETTMKPEENSSIYGAVVEILKMIQELPHVRRFCYCVLGVVVLYIVAPVIVAILK